MKKPIHGEKHHWFPKGMQRAWADADGKVARINSRGRSKTWHRSAIGYKADGHNILSEGGSPWDTTFEPEFAVADDAFPSVLEWLKTVQSAHPEGQRLTGVRIGAQRHLLAECLASLVVRSPRLRYLAERDIESFQLRELGFEQPRNLHQTAGANLRRLQEPFARTIREGGEFGFLIASEGSFLFGDGFMTNFNASADALNWKMAMTALTPEVAVLWFSPSSYPSFPEGVSITLDAGEVAQLNDIVQIYARDNLFFRGEPPKLHEAFQGAQHLSAHIDGASHRAPVVDSWMAEILEVWEES